MEITENKIKHYLPALKDFEILALSYMLEYQSQPFGLGDIKVFDIFERYMKVYLEEQYEQDDIKQIVKLMELFYIPQLCRSHPLYAFKEFINLIIKYPYFIFEVKFYRKILKIVWMTLKETEGNERSK